MRSGARECDQGRKVVIICRLERFDIGPSCLIYGSQAASSPSEAGLTQTDRQNIGHQSRPSAISVWKWVNENQIMMKPCGNLIRWKRLMLDPVANVVERFIQTELNPFSIDADVLV